MRPVKLFAFILAMIVAVQSMMPCTDSSFALSHGKAKAELVKADERLSPAKVKAHVKGKGNQGSEKQYRGKKEGLRNKTKEQLYQMARRQKLEGRSQMNKEELVNALEKTG